MVNHLDLIADTIHHSVDNPSLVYHSSTVSDLDSIQQIGDCLRQDYQHLLGTGLADELWHQGLSAADFQTWSGLEQTIHDALQIVADLMALEQQLTSGFLPIEGADQTQALMNCRGTEQSGDRDGQQASRQTDPALPHPDSGQCDRFPFMMLRSMLQRLWSSNSNPHSDPYLYNQYSDNQYSDNQFRLNSSLSNTTLPNIKSPNIKSLNAELPSEATRSDITLLNRTSFSSRLEQDKPHCASPIPSLYDAPTFDKLTSHKSLQKLTFDEPTSHESISHESTSDGSALQRPTLSSSLSPDPPSPALPTPTRQQSHSKHWSQLHDLDQESHPAANRSLSANRFSPVNGNHPTRIESADLANAQAPPRLRTLEDTPISDPQLATSNIGDLNIRDNRQDSLQVPTPRVVTGLRAVAQALVTAPSHLQTQLQMEEPGSSRLFSDDDPTDDLPITAAEGKEPTPLTQSASTSASPVLNWQQSHLKHFADWSQFHDLDLESHPAANRSLSANRFSPVNDNHLTRIESTDLANAQTPPRLRTLEDTPISDPQLATSNIGDLNIRDNRQDSLQVPAPRVVTGLRAVAQSLLTAPSHSRMELSDRSDLPTDHSIDYPSTALNEKDTLAKNELLLTENEWLTLPDAVDPISSQPNWTQLQAASSSAVGQRSAAPLPVKALPLEASQFPATHHWQEDSPATLDFPAGSHTDLDLDELLDAISREITREYRYFYGD